MPYKLAGLALGVALALVPPTASAAQHQVVLDIANMSCPACPYIVEQSLRKVNGVSDVEVSYEEKTARVVFDDAVTTPTALSEATAAVGFPSTPRESGS
jgi:periplasmic mercuric ion binding protein